MKEAILINKIDVRKENRQNSPKKNGSSDIDSIPFLKKLNIKLEHNKQPIQFTSNINEHIHGWAPYVQGFSSSFVQSIFDNYEDEYINPKILDPFAGCGTVLVQAKLNGFFSTGTELNPLLHFIAKTKLECWDISEAYFLKIFNNLPINASKTKAPSFLKSSKHFKPKVLNNLEILKGQIDSFIPKNKKQKKVLDLLLLAFSSILIDCSNLKRSPCLGYFKNKIVDDKAPFVLMNQKIYQIANDLKLIKEQYNNYINTRSNIFLANANNYSHKNKFDLVITSPPYMNGMDYVINYKIEMGWLNFANEQKELKKIKDEMVVCDNVSKGLIKNFSNFNKIYTNSWIEDIKNDLNLSLEKRGTYRRMDMPFIVHKYFDDMYKIMKNTISVLNKNGRFILVVGDSLIADVYIPTDLLIAKIGYDLGLEIEKIEKARTRRSGQIRSYKLRESIITLKRR